ncbi:MAG: putative ubiquitin-like protein YukD [Kiritimatiellia bacterium]|jgi:uncharacterized ubiquitin-like protein YukD
MTNQLGAGTSDAGTVTLRVQVVDVESAALDLVVPTYLPAKDVSQRIARDANLGAYWPDGTRREFLLRARGRLLGEDEKLQDLGVVAGELIHVLPQPPEGGQVIERPPQYPKSAGYRGGSVGVIIGTGLALVAFLAVWALGLTSVVGMWDGLAIGVVPAVAVAMLGVSAARHLFKAPGSSFIIPAVGLAIYIPSSLIAFVPAFAMGVDPTVMGVSAGVSFIAGLFGVVMGWLAWYGAVEPLPANINEEVQEQVAQQEQVAACAICGQGVDLSNHEMRHDCQYSCGRVFHSGCYRARAAIARDGQCAVCGYEPAAA